MGHIHNLKRNWCLHSRNRGGRVAGFDGGGHVVGFNGGGGTIGLDDGAVVVGFDRWRMHCCLQLMEEALLGVWRVKESLELRKKAPLAVSISGRH